MSYSFSLCLAAAWLASIVNNNDQEYRQNATKAVPYALYFCVGSMSFFYFTETLFLNPTQLLDVSYELLKGTARLPEATWALAENTKLVATVNFAVSVT